MSRQSAYGPDGHTYRCPKCHTDVSLWRDVELGGWESVDGQLEPTRKGSPDREADWNNAEPTGEYGCGECGWEGRKSELEKLGVDGEPLPPAIPGQESLL